MITLLCIVHIGLLFSLFHKRGHVGWNNCGWCDIKVISMAFLSAEVVIGLVVLCVTYLP